MTSTASATAITSAGVAPATRFRRRAMGTAGVLGGLLTAAGFAFTEWEGAEGTLAYLDSFVVDPVRSQVAALLLHYGYFGIVSVLLALGIMARRRHRVAGDGGLALSLPGALALPGLLITGFDDLAIRQALSAEQAVPLADSVHELEPAGFIAGPVILATFVGMTILGVAAWRAGFFHRLPTLAVPASFVAVMVIPIGVVRGLVQGAAPSRTARDGSHGAVGCGAVTCGTRRSATRPSRPCGSANSRRGSANSPGGLANSRGRSGG